jgi:cytochrome c biogenesis protein
VIQYAKKGFPLMSSPEDKKRNDVIWSALASVKLTLFLLIILAAASILGTVIPQQERAMEWAQQLKPSTFSFLNSLQLFDLYHSVWFRLIIGVLALNLVVCSIDRFPSSLKRYRTLPQPDRAKPYENLPPQRILSVHGDLNAVSNRVAEILKSRYRNVETKETEKGHYVSGEKGRYSHFSVYLVHFSVLLILIGGIVGSFFGFEGFVNIPEGGIADAVTLGKGEVPMKLPFKVRCDRFVAEFYDNGVPKEYRSDLSFIFKDRVALKGTLMVNAPITFMGITFYQSSYGTIPGNRVWLGISKGNGSENTALQVEVGKEEQLPGSSAHFQVADVRPDFMRMGPAVYVVVKPSQGDEVPFWVFQNEEIIRQHFPGIMEKYQKLNPKAFEPYAFTLQKIEENYYTGLQVNRDPGVVPVYLGFFFIIIGLFATFFISHRRVWIRISKSKNKVSVDVAGMANRNQAGFEKELDALAGKMRATLE